MLASSPNLFLKDFSEEHKMTCSSAQVILIQNAMTYIVWEITKPDYGSSLWQKFVYSIIGVVLPEQECENVYEKLNEKICLPPPIFFISLSFVQILAYVILVVRNYEFNLWEGCPGCYNETVKDKIVHKLVFLSYRRTDFWRYISYILIHSGNS
uniref:Uncharacterized protein n=1 Tax=Romanomermis culicivorax TaxID=13658 RepID=A0A915L1F2_ROMCU